MVVWGKLCKGFFSHTRSGIVWRFNCGPIMLASMRTAGAMITEKPERNIEDANPKNYR